MPSVNSVPSTRWDVQLLNYFYSLVESVKKLFFSVIESRDKQIHRALKDGYKWEVHQTNRVSDKAKSVDIKTDPKDPITAFFKTFFENLITSYFKASFIDKIKMSLAKFFSEFSRSQADNVVNFLLKDSEDLDLRNPTIREVVDKALPYFLTFAPSLEDKRKAIKTAIEKMEETGPKKSEEAKVVQMAIALSQNTTIREIERQLGKENVKPFLKELGKLLGPILLRSPHFNDSFSQAVYRTIRPLVEAEVGDGMQGVSPAVQVVAKIGSLLIGERIGLLFRNLNIKKIMDDLIVKGIDHLEAHRKAYEALPADKKEMESLYYDKFGLQAGCHENVRKIIQSEESTNHAPMLTSYFEEISSSLVNYVFADDVIDNFVVNLGSYKDELLKDVNDPVLRDMVDSILENREVLAETFKALKPVAIKWLAQIISGIGMKSLFSKKQLFRILFTQISPVVADVIHKVMIKNTILKHVNDAPFMEEFGKLYEGYCKDQNVDLSTSAIYIQVKQEYEHNVSSAHHAILKDRVPELTTGAFKELLEYLRLKGWDKTRLTTLKETLEEYQTTNNSDKNISYGQLVMKAIFGITEKHLGFSIAKGIGVDEHTPWLRDIFTDAFLNGVYNLRGVDKFSKPIDKDKLDPNMELFKLLEPTLKYYEDPKNVTALFQGEDQSWTDNTIKANTKLEAQKIGDILYDLIKEYQGKWAASGINILANGLRLEVSPNGFPRQIEFALLQLFGKNLTNYSLMFQILDILKAEIDAANTPVNANKPTTDAPDDTDDE